MPVDGTYAPQSPDLSSFLSSSTPVKPPPQPSTSTSSYRPRSPRLPDFTSPQNAPQRTQAPCSGYQVPPSVHQYQSFGDSGYQRRNSSYLPPIPDLPLSHNFDLNQGQQRHHSLYTSPVYQAPTDYSPFSSPQEAYSRQPYSLPQRALTYQPPPVQPPLIPHQQLCEPPQFKVETTQDPMAARVKRERAANGGVSEDTKPYLGASQGIEVKTKFPVARIKRIMQADEEVGKVAQVTPVAVCTSVPLQHFFILSRVEKKKLTLCSQGTRALHDFPRHQICHACPHCEL